ncbi:hypothetical protein [Clostridium sp.]|nr:hypothetical protein [uncultured Clostridium sp.]
MKWTSYVANDHRVLMALYPFVPAILGLIALVVFPNINPNSSIMSKILD